MDFRGTAFRDKYRLCQSERSQLLLLANFCNPYDKFLRLCGSHADGTLAGTYTPLHAFREAYAKARAIGVELADSSSSSEDEVLMPSPRTGKQLVRLHETVLANCT